MLPQFKNHSAAPVNYLSDIQLLFVAMVTGVIHLTYFMHYIIFMKYREFKTRDNIFGPIALCQSIGRLNSPIK